MKRRTLLSIAAAGALASLAARLGREEAEAAQDPDSRRHPLHRPAHDRARARARAHAHATSIATRPRPIAIREVERIKGDRNGQIDGLKDREWDVVIDNSGYVPRHVRLSAELLAPKVKQYVFIVVDLGLSELQRAARRNLAGRQVGR